MILPQRISSAGHPSTTIRPGRPVCESAFAAAMAAPILAGPIWLWPQACPAAFPRGFRTGEASLSNPGRASYSARMPTQGPSPVANCAKKAVGIPPLPRDVLNPFASSQPQRRSAARHSMAGSSGSAQSAWKCCSMTGRSPANAFRTLFFSAFTSGSFMRRRPAASGRPARPGSMSLRGPSVGHRRIPHLVSRR